MPFNLPELPYAKDALGEFMSAETLTYHHDKHHNAYVVRTNELIAEKGLDGRSLVDVIRHAKGAGENVLYNQSAQIWNHTFYWHCLAPAEGQKPTGRLAQLIEEGFGTPENLLAALKKEAVGHFSNGWAWLVLDGDKLKVTSLHDADTPVAYEGMKPLFTLDVWEHAYYIDYRNVRADFAEKVLGNIVNWDFVAQNLDGAGETRADQQS
ncbi:superoxide dismutase [Sphingomonas piscis]|uniref:Superoxide dismutase n=1 Tax=Sphingomonas piscis TaxID=2714943 RepID=A0A6G7YSG6_9SPHN|nr:superoxide dismutase [Sphingomonas piscis]QIK79686.1 superoxide dismutase [Sphingomonas piscis]